MRVLAIDPGPTQSAWVMLLGTEPTGWDITPNQVLRDQLARGVWDQARLTLEQIASYGMTVGAEVFETVYWSGRFAEAFGGSDQTHVSRIPRKQVCLHICHSRRANDATIRQALIDRYGGKAAAIGTKKAPGPLYGMKADLWQALALGLTYLDTQGV